MEKCLGKVTVIAVIALKRFLSVLLVTRVPDAENLLKKLGIYIDFYEKN